MSKVSRDNIGRFEITRELLANSEMEDLVTLFKDIFVLKMSDSVSTPNAILYVAVSKLFKPISEGDIIPLYHILISETKTPLGARRIKTKAEKINDKDDNWIYLK